MANHDYNTEKVVKPDAAMSETSLSILNSPGEPANTILTMEQCLQHQAELQPQTEAFIFYNGDGVRTSVTFSELYKKCKQFTSSMKRLGIGAKDVVIIALRNCEELLIAQFGLIMIGAIPFATGFQLKDFTDLIALVNRTKAVAILIYTMHTEGLYFNPNEFIENIGKTTLKFIISVDSETDRNGCLSLKHLMTSINEDNNLIDGVVDVDGVAAIMDTSGTTGPRKLLYHSYRNLYNILKFNKPSVLTESSFCTKVFSPAHFGWLGGTPLKEVFNGTPLVTITGSRWKMGVDDMLLIARKESCNILELTPDFLRAAIQQDIPIPKCVKYIYTGGAPIQQNFQNLLESVDYLVVGYGLLETGGIAGTIYTKNRRVEANIGGIPRPGVTIKIVNDNGEIVKRGVSDKILVKTPYCCIPYMGDEGLSGDEWINTDDIGYVSEKGELFVIGRQADCITVGGVTEYACAFEHVILSLRIEGISEVVVVPVPDKITYQQACAFVIKNSNIVLTEEVIAQALTETVFDSRKSKYILFVDSFPKNENGKVDRKLMQKIAIEKLHLFE